MDMSEETTSYLTRRNVHIGDRLWKLKSVFGLVIYGMLMIFYIPFFLFASFNLYKVIITMKVKHFFRSNIDRSKGNLGIASRRHKIIDMSAVGTADEIDFLVNRSFGYIRRMCFWTPKELTLFFLKEQRIQLISDQQLAYVVLSTVFAHSVKWDESRRMFHLNMEGLGDLQLFEGFYWDARDIFVSENGAKIIIKMMDGDEFHSDCEEKLRPNYDLAKLHAQVCLSFMGPGLLHNDVHFLLPSCMAVLCKNLLDRNKTLFKLMSPHFRFTERINFQALKVQKATNNKRSKFDRIFFLWQPFPVIKEVFREGIAKKCKQYYLEKGAIPCNEEIELSEEEEERVGQNGENNGIREIGDSEKNGRKQKQKLPRKHKLFPPDFIFDKDLRKVPYLDFLARYYKVIRNYICDLEPYIDKEEWRLLSTEAAKYVPRFDQANMVDAIASYILKVGVVHYCDHETYIRYFGYKYACMSMRTPFESLENLEAWKELECESKVNLESVKRDPLCLIFQRDVLRTRCFLNIFVDFIHNPKCNLFLADTNYDFDDFGPQMAEKRFKAKLNALDQRLRMEPVRYVPEPTESEVRAQGMQLIPLENILRTVCY